MYASACIYMCCNTKRFIMKNKASCLDLGSRRIELVHSDVFRPVLVPSLGKSVYYVSFIDEISQGIHGYIS